LHDSLTAATHASGGEAGAGAWWRSFMDSEDAEWARREEAGNASPRPAGIVQNETAQSATAHPNELTANAPSAEPLNKSGATAPAAKTWSARRVRLAILSIWLAGALAFLTLQCVRIVRMTLRLRTATPADEALQRDVSAYARRLGMRPVATRVVIGFG